MNYDYIQLRVFCCIWIGINREIFYIYLLQDIITLRTSVNSVATYLRSRKVIFHQQSRLCPVENTDGPREGQQGRQFQSVNCYIHTSTLSPNAFKTLICGFLICKTSKARNFFKHHAKELLTAGGASPQFLPCSYS